MRKLRAGETEANKPRMRRSFTGASGSLFIEAAIITPIAFVGLLGAIEIMNVYLQRGSVINVANSIAMAIQQNPDITAQEMYEFQKSLGGGVTPFKEVKISDGSPYTGTSPCSVADCRVTGLDIRIGASTTPVQEPDIRNLAPSDWSSPNVGKLPGQANPAWPNAVSPLKADPNQSAADDANAYYVGVRVAWQNRPVFTRLGFASVTTTQFAGVVVKPPALQGALRGACGHIWGGMLPIGEAISPAFYDTTARSCPPSPTLSDQGLVCRDGCSCPVGFTKVLTGTCMEGTCATYQGYKTGGMYWYSCVEVPTPVPTATPAATATPVPTNTPVCSSQTVYWTGNSSTSWASGDSGSWRDACQHGRPAHTRMDGCSNWECVTEWPQGQGRNMPSQKKCGCFNNNCYGTQYSSAACYSAAGN